MSDTELRLTIVEGKVAKLEQTSLDHHGKFERFDEKMEGMREQAKEHHNSVTAITSEMDKKLDKVIAAVGADLEGTAPAELRKDFAHLRATRMAKEMTQDWVRKSLIGAFVAGILFLLAMGATHYIKREIETIDRGEHGESSDRGSLSKPATNLPGVPATR